jgi:hypothetical protein
METQNDLLNRQKREFDAHQRSIRRENKALTQLRYETDPIVLAQCRYARKDYLPPNAMFSLPSLGVGTVESWVNVHVPHGFGKVFRGTGPIPPEFLDDDGNLHSSLKLWTGSSGKLGEVTYEDLLEARNSERKNVHIPRISDRLMKKKV